MIDFLLKMKLLRKCKTFPTSNGMTYVELIVVLSIFAVLSTVVIFNYGDFQAKVDIKNLASDIALQIVTAQKDSLNGVLPLTGAPFPTWKPSYGVYFNTVAGTDIYNPIPTPFNKEFIYFADLSNLPNGYDVINEAKNYINITKNNSILSIQQCSTEPCGSPAISSLAVVFKRPDSRAKFYLGNLLFPVTGSNYIKITIQSPKSNISSFIRVYSSGRVQVN